MSLNPAQKLKYDLSVIEQLVSTAKYYNWRLVISGGYGLDFALGRFTRNHGDLDAIFYGTHTREKAKTLFDTSLNTILLKPEIEIKDEEFFLDIKVKSGGFVGNFYYVQVNSDPHISISTVIKKDGTTITNSPTDFPPPIPGQIGELQLECQDQLAHLQDILRKGGDANPKYTQDIELIKKHFSPTA